MKTTCSTPDCQNPRRNGKQRYCNPCHARWMRNNPRKPLTEEQREKQLCRYRANYARRKGDLIPKPCKCGNTKVEMHHEDYSKPLEVVWICKNCHAEHHKNDDLVKKKPKLAA